MNKSFDYQKLAYSLLHHKNHQFVSFNSYFKDTPALHLQTINTLYNELLIIECNRPDSIRRDTAINHYNFNPYLLSDFKNWIITDNTGFPRLNHLLDFYTYEQLFNAFQELTHKNFIKSHTYKKSMYLLYPVLNQFLPLTYAYVKLLYHIKKLYELKNNIVDTIKNTKTLKTELYNKYNNLDKDTLVSKLINNDIKKIEHLKKSEIDKNSILFQSIIEQLKNYVLPLALQTYLKPLDNNLYNNQSNNIDFNDLLNNDFKSISNIDLLPTTNDFKQKSINQDNINSDMELNNNIDLQPLKLIESDNISEIDNLDIVATKLFKIDKIKSIPDSKTFDIQNSEIFDAQNQDFFSDSNLKNFSDNDLKNFSESKNKKVFLKLPEKIQATKEKLLINPKKLL